MFSLTKKSVNANTPHLVYAANIAVSRFYYLSPSGVKDIHSYAEEAGTKGPDRKTSAF